MNKILRNIIYISLWFPLAGFAASFDCNKASTSVESLICSNTDLSLADEEMASVYKKAKQVNPEITISQKAWLKQRNACKDAVCLRTAIAERTKILTAMLSNSGQPAKDINQSISKVSYKCDDGRNFTIEFITAKGEEFPSKAKLVVSDSKAIEILDNSPAGSSFVMTNENYNYIEHHGSVYLEDAHKTPQKGSSIYQATCLEVK
jgi:uncharacterized protein